MFSLLDPILDNLKNGYIVRKVVALLFRIQGWVIALAMLIFALIALKQGFNDYLPWQATLASIIVALIGIGLGFSLLQIYLYHAREIEALEDSPFTLSPIVAIYIRTIGEIYALMLLLLGFALFIATLLAGGMSLPFHLPDFLFGEVRQLFSGNNFLSGLVILLYSVMSSFIILMVAYFIAERIIVSTDMATNIRALVNRSNPKKQEYSNSSNHPINETISQSDDYSELEKLSDLRSRGIISEVEFEREKAIILQKMGVTSNSKISIRKIN